MLARAERRINHRTQPNVKLIHGDASRLELDAPVDAVLFSLSYSVLPDRQPVLARAWDALAPGGKLVIMDAGLPNGALGRVLEPFGERLATVFPGGPYSRPWEDLRSLTPVVQSEWSRLALYFICQAEKPG